MFNYQPLHIRSEWSLFIYNLKLLWRRRKIPLLGQRINRETYAFCEAFSWAGLLLSLFFFSPFICLGIITRVEAIYGMYALHLVIYLFALFVLGRRLQEWGIPQECVLLIFGVCAWGTYHMGYPMFFDINDPFAVARGSAGNSVVLNLPQYMEWTFFFTFIGFFIPNCKKKNKFGEAPKKGIILFGKCVSDVDIANQKYIEDLDEIKFILSMSIKSGRSFLVNTLNFRGRTAYDDFGIIGLIMLGCQGIAAMSWYTGHSLNIDDPFFVCMVLHIVFFIPTISLCIRRLHDGYHSAFLIPFMYIPLFNLYVYSLLLFKKSWEIEDIEK